MNAFAIAGFVLIAVIGYVAWIAERDVVQAIIVTCAVTFLLAILAIVIAFSFGIGSTTM